MNEFMWYLMGKKRGGGGSGGGGGGNLAPGVYWRNTDAFPSNYKSAPFVFQGNLYAVANTSDSYKHEIWKYENGAYVKVADFTTNNYWNADYSVFAELNGKIHIINTYNNFHHIWDGVSAIAESAATPYQTATSTACVYNGVLCVWAGSYFCKWNESTQAFSKGTFDYTTNVENGGALFSYNGELYNLGTTYGRLHRLNITDYTATLVGTFGQTKSKTVQLMGQELYFSDRGFSGGGVMKKYNMETGELTQLPGYLPALSSTAASCVFNDEYYIGAYRCIQAMCLVEAPSEE